jgi:quercetin dioxygenase-like cupin family protein
MINYPVAQNKLPVAFNAWKLIQNNKVELIKICLKPGEIIEPHINPVPVIFYCVSGRGDISVEDVKEAIEKDAAVHIDSGLNRALANNGEEDLEVVVFKLTGIGV